MIHHITSYAHINKENDFLGSSEKPNETGSESNSSSQPRLPTSNLVSGIYRFLVDPMLKVLIYLRPELEALLIISLVYFFSY